MTSQCSELIATILFTNHCPLQIINIPKVCDEDTTLTTSNAAGEKLTIPVPKGTRIIIDSPGLHYNREDVLFGRCLDILSSFSVARYWKDPHSFKPARFLEDWPRDAFVPFSAGGYYLLRMVFKVLLFSLVNRSSRMSRKKVCCFLHHSGPRQ